MFMSTRELCRLCYHPNAVGFRVPDDIWAAIVPEFAADSVVCLSCFTRIGDERAIPWDQAIEFFPVSLATHFGLGRAG